MMKFQIQTLHTSWNIGTKRCGRFQFKDAGTCYKLKIFTSYSASRVFWLSYQYLPNDWLERLF